MSTLNDIGVGLLGFTGALNQGMDRALRQRMFELQARGLDRQEALARSQIEIEQQKLAQSKREYDMQEQFYTNMPGVGQGGQAQPPQVNQQVTPQVNPENLSQGNRDLTDYWGRWYGLSDEQRALLPRIMSAESGGNQWAHRRESNGSDSFGPMQINSVNLGMLGPGENIFDPSVNTRIGTEIFKRNLDQFGGDTTKALWGYNAGPERVKQGVMPDSTRAYIGKITGSLTSPTPPGTNYAAAPTNTATDAGGVAPKAPPQQGAPNVDPNMVAYMLRGTMSPSKQVRDASSAWISNNKAAVDIFNARSPEYLENIKRETHRINSGVDKENRPKNYQYKENVGVFDPETGKVVEPVAPQNKLEEKTRHLRDKFVAGSKPFLDSKQAFSRIITAGKDQSAAGDLGMIFAYMKMLDPGSTVREGEFANAQNSRGVPDQIRAQWNKLVSGERLTPEQRQAFAGQAYDIFKTDRAAHDQHVSEHKRMANLFELPEDGVVQNYTADIDAMLQDPSVSSLFKTKPGAPVAGANYDMYGNPVQGAQ